MKLFKIGLILIASTLLAFTGCKQSTSSKSHARHGDEAHDHAGHDHAEHKGHEGHDHANESKKTSPDKKDAVKKAFDNAPQVGQKAFCPVMKNEFTVTEKTETATYKGKVYAFCCPGCKPSFEADPEKYL